MIPRAELLMALSTILDLEEKGTKMALEAIEKGLPEADLPEEERRFLADEVLEVIEEESRRHGRIVEDLISALKEDQRDAL